MDDFAFYLFTLINYVGKIGNQMSDLKAVQYLNSKTDRNSLIMIILLCNKFTSFTADEVRRLTGFSEKAVKRAVCTLEEKGFVIQKSNYYFLTEKSQRVGRVLRKEMEMMNICHASINNEEFEIMRYLVKKSRVLA